MKIGKLLIFGGLAVGGYWLWNRRNLSDQIVVRNPKFKGFSGGKLQLYLPIENISDVDVTFNGFSGVCEKRTPNQAIKQLGTAIIQTPVNGTLIKAKQTTSLVVDVSVNVLTLGAEIISIISSGDLSALNAWIKGNCFITSALVKVPVDMQIY